MKEVNGMKRGVKLDPQPTNSQRIRELDTKLENMQMASRMTQMMVQQLMSNLDNMSKDLGKAFGVINELQYKILAMQTVANLDVDALNSVAGDLRLKDFNEASDAEDAQGNFVVADTVGQDSTVIITSTTQDGAGLFRSRIKLSESGVPALVEGLLGQKVGAKVTCQLNNVEHVVELLGIRNPPAPVVVEQTEVSPVVQA
jgi:hypothetical protein